MTALMIGSFRVLALVTVVVGVAAAAPDTGVDLAPCETLTVEQFSIEVNSATEDFPRGQEVQLQLGGIARLQKTHLFREVLARSAGSAEIKGCALSGTVVKYDKGSRTARWMVGFGAGATKVKVRFVVSDAGGRELLRADREGKFYGTFGFVGGSKEHADTEAAGDVIDGLIREIRKRMPVVKTTR